MALGDAAPDPSALEVLSGSPFGVQLLGGFLPLFDPYAWNPNLGLEQAVELLGWSCDYDEHTDPESALVRLRERLGEGPVLVGPLDMGLLLHQPGSDRPTGADHFVLITELDDDVIVFHDPHGHPYATLPIASYLRAWRAEQIGYLTGSFAMRSRFRHTRAVAVDDALRASLPLASAWANGRMDLPTVPGSLGGSSAVEELATRVDEGLEPGVRAALANFGLRIGARRLADAATQLERIGVTTVSAIAVQHAKLIGALQLPLVRNDDVAVGAGLRRLAPTYDDMTQALAAEAIT